MNIYDIWFSRIDISNDVKLRLLEKFDVTTLWNFTNNELFELGLLESTINQILDNNYRNNLEKYVRYFAKNGIELITVKQANYPVKLLNISSRPAYIYVRGNQEILDDDSVAIIGSRQCTENGKRLAYNTAKELGNKNINTISGLAIRY